MISTTDGKKKLLTQLAFYIDPLLAALYKTLPSDRNGRLAVVEYVRGLIPQANRDDFPNGMTEEQINNAAQTMINQRKVLTDKGKLSKVSYTDMTVVQGAILFAWTVCSDMNDVYGTFDKATHEWLFRDNKSKSNQSTKVYYYWAQLNKNLGERLDAVFKSLLNVLSGNPSTNNPLMTKGALIKAAVRKNLRTPAPLSTTIHPSSSADDDHSHTSMEEEDDGWDDVDLTADVEDQSGSTRGDRRRLHEEVLTEVNVIPVSTTSANASTSDVTSHNDRRKRRKMNYFEMCKLYHVFSRIITNL